LKIGHIDINKTSAWEIFSTAWTYWDSQRKTPYEVLRENLFKIFFPLILLKKEGGAREKIYFGILSIIVQAPTFLPRLKINACMFIIDIENSLIRSCFNLFDGCFTGESDGKLFFLIVNCGEGNAFQLEIMSHGVLIVQSAVCLNIVLVEMIVKLV